MFKKVLVANRGAVAARVIRALRQMGIASVAVHSEADAGLPYLAQADEAHAIGPAAPQQSYLNQQRLLQLMQDTGCDALHPGYGFLSENAGFASAVHAAGATFIGPSPRWIEAMGHKTRARALMAAHGMPVAPSTEVLHQLDEAALTQARAIGFPVLVKPAGGGGGIGMLPARDEAELQRAFAQATSVATRSFGSADLYLEKLVEQPRHIEFQILADRHGSVRHVFERDCSVQRRHQKVIEESPAPGLPRDEALAMARHVAGLLQGLGYDVIGTVEMLYTPALGFMFLEMNTRLQVEHAVTEAVCGIDLVQAQVRLAAGERLDAVLPDEIQPRGHAIEARIYAEDPVRFFPSPGLLERLNLPAGPGLRVETGYAAGCRVTPDYDPLVAKLIAHADTRAGAIERLRAALHATDIAGVKTNIPFLLRMLDQSDFAQGRVHTGLAQHLLAAPA
ncbi:MAG: biotin carboxylase [Comamonadaceae bacterium]|nr:MAG: biotin carboxylase [Comamonadaceae bacterium]